MRLSFRNEKWLLARGAVEYGKGHYPWMLTMHTAFVFSIIAEYLYFPGKNISYPFLLVFAVIVFAKMMIIRSLGYYWNTKIYRIPGSLPVHKGVYKYIKHPNYILVAAEIMFFPLIFHLYYTAIIFTLLNAVMLFIRIKAENRVWKD